MGEEAVCRRKEAIIVRTAVTVSAMMTVSCCPHPLRTWQQQRRRWLARYGTVLACPVRYRSAQLPACRTIWQAHPWPRRDSRNRNGTVRYSTIRYGSSCLSDCLRASLQHMRCLLALRCRPGALGAWRRSCAPTYLVLSTVPHSHSYCFYSYSCEHLTKLLLIILCN